INGETFPFGVMPWLLLYVLHSVDLFGINEENSQKKIIHCAIVSFLLGWIYWLKYSAFIVAFSAFLYLQYSWLIQYRKKTHLKEKIFGTLSSLFLFSIPYLLLGWVNFIFARSYDYIQQAENSVEFSHYYDPTNHGIFLLIALIGAAGLSLFQTSHLFTYLIYFNTTLNPFIELSFNEKGIPLSIAGIPGTFLIIWLLFRMRKKIERKFILFACWTGFFPFFILAYLAGKLNYNYLIYNTRHASSSFLLIEAIVIASLWNLLNQTFQTQNLRRIGKKLAVLCAIVLFAILPHLFHISFFLKDKIIERRHDLPYIQTENHFYVPILSTTNLNSVVSDIHSLIVSSRDIIVLAIDENTNFEAWLEMKQRTFPLVRAYGSLAQSHGESVSIYSEQPLLSSQKLRIILVVSPLVEDNPQRLYKLQQRFPQASTWTKLDNQKNSDTKVTIYFTDLDVH
ncbi:MAG: hypothetical protein AB4290_06395, partial [Spirulina sp.]